MSIYTTETFISRANKIHNFKFNYSKSIYIGTLNNLIIICSLHGEFTQRPNNHLNGQSCPICAMGARKQKLSLSLNKFIYKANKIHNFKYDYSKVKYVNNRIKIIIICPYHNEFQQRPNDHLHNKGCAECGKILAYSNLNNFIVKAEQIHNYEFSYSKSIYVNSKTKLEIICKKHGSFWQKPNNHLSGQKCPRCKESIGERKITDFLIKENINFKSQYKIKDCRNKLPLPFDFAIFDSNQKLVCLIEYQGYQHFFPCSFGGTDKEKKFQNQIIADSIKNNFCIKNTISFLKIPYWEFENIPNILANYLIFTSNRV